MGMKFTSDIDGYAQYLINNIERERQAALATPRLRDKHAHRARKAAFSEALENLDIAIRSSEDRAVALRSTDEIAAEVKQHGVIQVAS